MAGLDAVPLVLAVLAILAVTLANLTGPTNRALSRLALAVFGRYVRRRQEIGSRQAGASTYRADLLRSAHMHTTYRVYAAKTLLYTAVLALAGSVISVYIVGTIFTILNVPAAQLRNVFPEQLAFLANALAVPQFSATELFVLLLVSNATIGVTMGYTVYRARWWWPEYRADARQRLIDTTLERTVAFVYALSRSGMTFTEVMRILAQNKDVYGEAAEEVEIAVRDMDLFGTDTMAALERLSERTPSDRFSDFSENLVSVLRSGRSISEFLRDQYEYYKEESESEQEQFLDLLATLAEAYVTVLVAGPLFLITILVVIGLVMGGTLSFLRVLVYFIVPLGTLGFVVYLDSLTTGADLSPESREIEATFGEYSDVRHAENVAASTRATDGGTVTGDAAAAGRDDETAKNRARLTAYNRLRWLRRRLRDPVGLMLRSPTALLYVTVPVAVLYVLGRGTSLVLAGTLSLQTADDVAVQAALFVVGTFAVVYELHRRRIRAIEGAIPDFLDRLASVNEAGMPIIESLGQVVESELGGLDAELRRTWADVQWGARVENALYRFERRVGTATATRAVALITNAMQASGDIGPVLRIAADQTQAARRLQRKRRQELMTYVVVIYLSFAVFITIIIALNLIFLPNVPSISDFGSNLPGGIGGGGGKTAPKSAYALLFFHSSLVQAVCSGLVAGQMGESSIKGGAKHAAAMLAIAYLLFVALG